MNDVLLMALLVTGFFTVLLVIGWIQEGREIERKKPRNAPDGPRRRMVADEYGFDMGRFNG